MAISIDYKDLKGWAKIALGSILVISPIWLLDLYLFKRNFFNSAPLYISICMAYCLTLPLLSLNTFFGWMVLDTAKVKHEYSMYYGTAITVVSLLTLTFAGWYHKFDFITFLKYSYYISGALFGVRYVFSIIKGVRIGLKDKMK